MFALFGQLFGKEHDLSNRFKNAFQNIEGKPETFNLKADGYIYSIGQSPNPDFFHHCMPFMDDKEKRVYAIQGYLWRNAYLAENEAQAASVVKEHADSLIENGYLRLPDDSGGMFILIACDIKTQVVYITEDISGIIPLYYSICSDGEILFSTHIRPLAKIIDAKVDEIGVIQQAAFHHTIGSRTLFKEIKRLNPGETLRYHAPSKQLTFLQPTGYYSHLDTYSSDNDASDALWSDYISGIKPLSEIKGSKGILLSGGFDTRLVVAGFKNFQNNLVAITFGDEESYEVDVARRVSQLADAHQEVYTPIDDHNLTDESISRLINQAEFANFPYCETGARSLMMRGSISASTGYGGESFLGGQAYVLLGTEWSQKERFSLAIRRSVGFAPLFSESLRVENQETVVSRIYQYFDRILLSYKNHLNPAWLESFEETRQILLEDITSEFSRIMVNQPETIQQAVERFWIEHHVLKHFGRQELTLMSSLPVILPTVHHAFFRRCSNLPPARKVDHGIYLKLVKRHLGELAKIPTANIPVNLTRHELILWMMRAWRAQSDKRLIRNMMKSRGAISGRRNGWSNFEHWLRSSTFFDELPHFVSRDIFLEESLNKRIRRIRKWDERVFSGQDFLTMVTISQILNLKNINSHA